MDDKSLFNKAEFAMLLEKAKGDRSINQYASDTEVSAAHISRFLRELIDAPPAPETISKLASKAYNDITYQDMMIAAGHLARRDDSNEHETIEVREDSPTNFRNQMELIEKRFMQIILADLYDKPFEWSPVKPEGRMRFPDMILNIDDAEYKRWYLEFKATFNSRSSISLMHFQSVYGMIAMTELNATDKFTIVVNDIKLFDYYFKRPPLSLKANIYVMLIDLEKGQIIHEEKLCSYA